MEKPKQYTLAPKGHPTDAKALETMGYKLWSTYREHAETIDVRTNNECAGGQVWRQIARKVSGVWRVARGDGFLGQGGKLLTRHLIARGEKVRSEVTPPEGDVVVYPVKGAHYSLPSLLNGGEVVNRDREADRRSDARKAWDPASMAAKLAEIQAARAAAAKAKKAKEVVNG